MTSICEIRPCGRQVACLFHIPCQYRDYWWPDDPTQVTRSSAVVVFTLYERVPDNRVHWDNMGPIWSGQDPSGPHVGPMNFAIWGSFFVRVGSVNENLRHLLNQRWPIFNCSLTNKPDLKMTSVKCRPFCPGLYVLRLPHVPLIDANGMHYRMSGEWNVPDDNNMTDGTNGCN